MVTNIVRRLLAGTTLLALLASPSFAKEQPNRETGTAVHERYTRDAQRELPQKSVTALSVTGNVSFAADDGFVRVLLLDDQGRRHLVYEATPPLTPETDYRFADACVETCAMSPTAGRIEIQVEHATLTLEEITARNDGKRRAANEEYRAKRAHDDQNVAWLRAQSSSGAIRWTPGHTTVSAYSYEQKLALFRSEDGRLNADQTILPYYKGGVFEPRAAPQHPTMDARTDASRVTATKGGPYVTPQPVPLAWSWRHAHGKNWLTSVKRQLGPDCWAFATVGTFEAQLNVHYNTLLDWDLSEQMLIDLSSNNLDDPDDPICGIEACAVTTGGCYPGQLFCKTSTTGLIDEVCDPYTGASSSDGCTKATLCDGWEFRRWFSNGFQNFLLTDKWESSCSDEIVVENETQLKRALVYRGPMSITYPAWNHDMVLAGYAPEAETGETVWELKNSWGADWGEEGYARLKVPFREFYFAGMPLGPFAAPNGTPKNRCTDDDGDRYCVWGTVATEKPESCPWYCNATKDCDDADPAVGACTAPSKCHDPDKGITPTAATTVQLGDAYYADACLDSRTVLEWYCSNDTTVTSTLVDCGNFFRCYEGKCAPPVRYVNGTTSLDPIQK